MKKIVLIRDRDYKKEKKILEAKYDRISWQPLTQAWLQKQATWFTMKGNRNIANQYLHHPWPGEWLKRTRLSLHNKQYIHWLSRWDEQGQFEIRAGLNQPNGLLGVAIFEIDEIAEEAENEGS